MCKNEAYLIQPCTRHWCQDSKAPPYFLEHWRQITHSTCADRHSADNTLAHGAKRHSFLPYIIDLCVLIPAQAVISIHQSQKKKIDVDHFFKKKKKIERMKASLNKRKVTGTVLPFPPPFFLV